MQWKDVVKCTAGCVNIFALADTTPLVYTNWDTPEFHENLKWVLRGGAEHDKRVSLATALLRTGARYNDGYLDGNCRMLALGVQLATVVACQSLEGHAAERRVVSCHRIPQHSPGVLSRVLANIGGHLGGIARRAVVQRGACTEAVAETVEAAQAAIFDRSFATLRGAAHVTRSAATALLKERGAHRVSDTTPPLARTEHHDDALVPDAFETMLDAPLLTVAGNLNAVPHLYETIGREAVADLTLRRRLVIFQQATGAAPPAENARFKLPPWAKV